MTMCSRFFSSQTRFKFRIQMIAGALFASSIVAVVFASSPTPAPTVSAPGASVSPGTEVNTMPALSVIPEPTGADMVPAALRPDETKKLLAEFKKAQSSEAKALDHRQKMELKELKASQSARQKEWENKEKLARHEFFRLHSKGPERRAYIQDFLERRKAFVSLLSDERSKRVHEQEIRRNSLKEDQASRFQEFQSFLGRGERPPARLWPQLGG